MVWWIVPAVAAGVAAAGTAGTSIAANKATGNKARIKEIKRAKAQGELTAEGEAMAEAGLQQQRRGITALADQQRQIMAMQGATSGQDIRAAQEATNTALADLGERTARQMREVQASESQELEDRSALRRQRTMKTIQSTIGAGASAFGAASSVQGMTSKQTKGVEAPDFSGAGEAASSFEAAWNANKKMLDAGEMSFREFQKATKAMERYYDTSPDSGLTDEQDEE